MAEYTTCEIKKDDVNSGESKSRDCLEQCIAGLLVFAIMIIAMLLIANLITAERAISTIVRAVNTLSRGGCGYNYGTHSYGIRHLALLRFPQQKSVKLPIVAGVPGFGSQETTTAPPQFETTTDKSSPHLPQA